MNSSTLIGRIIPDRVGPVSRIEYPGGVHVKPKFVDDIYIPDSWQHVFEIIYEDGKYLYGEVVEGSIGKILDITV